MAGEDTNQGGNIKQENNVAQAGLNLDQSIAQIPKGKLTYALNAALENFDSSSTSYQNEQGNELCLQFPTDFHLIGTHFIPEKNKHVFFLTNVVTGGSQIGYMDNNDCIYHTYIEAACLNFNIDNPIHKVVHKITNCTTEIYWTDGLNSRRYLDLNPENLPLVIKPGTDVCDNETINVIDCNKLKIQPDFEIPSLTIHDVTTGGSLKAGTYQFAIQYCDASGDGYTSYYSVTNPTPIANERVTDLNFDYEVGKSIVVNIDNIDVTGYFNYYNIAVIKSINAITSVELVGTFSIDRSYEQVTYTGQNVTQIRLTINDIFEKFPYYDVAQDLTSVQDILVWDNLISIDRINYQRIANEITLQWQTYKIPSTENYSDELNATNLRGYLRDEVYAFEIVFLLKNGKQTDGFHIPGRKIGSQDLQFPDVPNTNPDFVGEPEYKIGDVGYSPYWKIYNTANVLGDGEGDVINNAVPYKYGNFAYWESTETYPCNEDVWGGLSNTPIRHHKFPDVLISPIIETPTIVYSNGKIAPVIQNDAIFPIGIKIDSSQVMRLIMQSNLTTDQKDNIAAFKIVRGDRSTNKSIVAKGILRNVGKYTRDETDYYFPNYPYNDLNVDPFLLGTNNAYSEQCISYRIERRGSGTITVDYTNCTENVSAEIVYNDLQNFYYLCSTSRPVVDQANSTSAPVAIVSLATYDEWRICANSFTRGMHIRYVNPVTGPARDWIPTRSCRNVNSISKPYRDDGANEYTITLQRKFTPPTSCSENNKLISITELGAEAQYRQVFNSPETSFGQPFLGNILKLESAIFGAGTAHFVKVKKNAEYKLLSKEAQQDALKSSADLGNITDPFNPTAMFTAYQAYLTIYINGITRKNYAYSFNSIASYDYSVDVENTIQSKQRTLDIAQYLIPGVQSVGDVININNYQRESSVYLKTKESYSPLLFPNNIPVLNPAGVNSISDSSRFTISGKGNCLVPAKENSINVVSYYASLKNTFVNQWGQIYSYDTIDTGFQRNVEVANILNNNISTVATVFGGDTFISRFAFKTKLPFFIDNRVGAPDDSDIFYDEIGNVAYPQYWHSARSILSDYAIPYGRTPLLKNIISIKAHNFDCPNTQTADIINTDPNAINNPNRTYYDGKFYLFAYGVPSFYCESTINTDLRQAFNNKEGDFFPHVSTGIPDDWLQESYVSIAFDNTYFYNTSFSKQNRENFFSHLPVNWQAQLCFTNFPFRTIYSDAQQSFSDNKINSWLIYRPISYFDFPQNYGKLVSLDGIQNKAILARFENKSLLYNTMLTINTSNPQAAYLGNSTLFKSSPPIDFAETDLGYVGSQNKFLLKIPQGQITVDAKRGQVFLISGNQAQDLTQFGSGMNRFFTDHLAFEILRYFPNVDVDNHFSAVGLHGVYDSKFERVIISKLDYIPLNSNIKYEESTREFYYIDSINIRRNVLLTDPEFFCNKSWTLSYNMNTQSWVSFHSYIPNFYIGENNFFYSGLNDGCDFDAAIAAYLIPTPSTSSTSTTIRPPDPTTTTTSTTIACNFVVVTQALGCGLAGQAIAFNCDLAGTAFDQGGSAPFISCATFTDSFYQYVGSASCSGTTDTYNKVTVTLYDQFGNPYIAPSNIAINLNFQYITHQEDGDSEIIIDTALHVLSGNSSFDYIYSPYSNQPGNISSQCGVYYDEQILQGYGTNSIPECA